MAQQAYRIIIKSGKKSHMQNIRIAPVVYKAAIFSNFPGTAQCALSITYFYSLKSVSMQDQVLLLSTSTVYGHNFLEYSRDVIKSFMHGLTTPLLFVPYAADEREWHTYTAKVATFFATLGIPVTGIHTVPAKQIPTYKAVFVGGGNTFRLLAKLQQLELLPVIAGAVQAGSMRYMGSSAGSNMAGKTICTTNDMPIVYPAKGFDALNLVPYQLNPHYLDPDPASKHKGETRDQRIAEYHQMNDTPVIALREGAYLAVGSDFNDTKALYIGGGPGAKIFLKGRPPYEALLAQPFVLDRTAIRE